MNTNANSVVNHVSADVRLRQLPYPYRGMLAICSDLDETPDRHVYWEIMRLLNTTETTAMGPGVGLQVGNTICFDMPPDQSAVDGDRPILAEIAVVSHGHLLFQDAIFGDAGYAADRSGRSGQMGTEVGAVDALGACALDPILNV